MPRFRYRTPTHKGHWHPTRKEAEEAAIEKKLGSRDEHTGQFYKNVECEIERE